MASLLLKYKNTYPRRDSDDSDYLKRSSRLFPSTSSSIYSRQPFDPSETTLTSDEESAIPRPLKPLPRLDMVKDFNSALSIDSEEVKKSWSQKLREKWKLCLAGVIFALCVSAGIVTAVYFLDAPRMQKKAS